MAANCALPSVRPNVNGNGVDYTEREFHHGQCDSKWVAVCNDRFIFWEHLGVECHPRHERERPASEPHGNSEFRLYLHRGELHSAFWRMHERRFRNVVRIENVKP